MKTLVIKGLITVIATITLACGIASAQASEYNVPVTSFSSLSVSDDFVVIVQHGETCSLRLAVEKAYQDYVQAFVKDNTLSIGLDERKVPSDVKKRYSGKDVAAPVFRAYVTVPSVLGSVSLSDKASIQEFSADAVSPSSVKFLFSDNTSAVIPAIKSDQVEISIDKKAHAEMNVTASKVAVYGSGSADLALTQTVSLSEINLSATCSLTTSGSASTMTVNAKGAGKAVMNGTATSVKFVQSGTSNVNAINLTCDDADVELGGFCSLTEAASKKLQINVSNGAKLTFSNSPVIVLGAVKTATVVPYSTK